MTALVWERETRTSFAHLWAVPTPDEYVVLEEDAYVARIEQVEEFRPGFFRVTWRVLEGMHANRRAKTVWPFNSHKQLRDLGARLQRAGINWREMQDADDVRRALEGLVVRVEMTEARSITSMCNHDVFFSVLR